MTKVLVEMGMPVDKNELNGTAELRIDTPAGLVTATATLNSKVTHTHTHTRERRKEIPRIQILQ